MFEYDYKLQDFAQLKARHDPKLVDRAMKTAVARTTNKARTALSKAVRADYARIQAARIRKELRIVVRNNDEIMARVLLYTGKRIGAIHWKYSSAKTKKGTKIAGAKRVSTERGRRYQARYRFGTKKPVIARKGAFVGTGRTSGSQQMFQRVGSDRLKIRKLTGPAIAQMVTGENELKTLDDLVEREMPKEFNSAMDHFVQQAAGLR